MPALGELGGHGGGEDGFSGGVPGAGVGPVPDDHDGVVTGLVDELVHVVASPGPDDGGVGVESVGSERALLLPGAPGASEAAEGGGVAARLGREVPAEAEHVGPGAKTELLDLGAAAEVPAGVSAR